MRKIKIAPNRNEVRVTDYEISTEWHNKPCYMGDFRELRAKYGDEWLADAFSTALAMSSYSRQAEAMLNAVLRIEGRMAHRSFYFVQYNGKVMGTYKSVRACLNLVNRKGWSHDTFNALYIVDNLGTTYSTINGQPLEY